METKNYQKPTMMVVMLEHQYPLLEPSPADPSGHNGARTLRDDGFDED